MRFAVLVALVACTTSTGGDTSSTDTGGDTTAGGAVDCLATREVSGVVVPRDGAIDWGGRAAAQSTLFTYGAGGTGHQDYGGFLWEDTAQADQLSLSGQFSATWIGDSGGWGPGEYTIVTSASEAGVTLGAVLAEQEGTAPSAPWVATGGTIAVTESDIDASGYENTLCRALAFRGVTFDEQNGDGVVSVDAVLVGTRPR